MASFGQCIHPLGCSFYDCNTDLQRRLMDTQINATILSCDFSCCDEEPCLDGPGTGPGSGPRPTGGMN